MGIIELDSQERVHRKSMCMEGFDKTKPDSLAMDVDAIVAEGRQVFRVEIAALERAQAKLDKALARAANIILSSSGKVVFIGVGKSGLIAQSIASSFRSTGTPAVFINGSEALHGDLGVYAPGDPSVLISNSGSTGELLRMIPTLRHLGSPIIAIVGNPCSPLAQTVDVVLNAEVTTEADPLNLVPTSSATVALVLGHALVAILMRAKGFSQEQFSIYHPAGLLGRSLTLRVADVMHTDESLPRVGPDTPIKDVIVEISAKMLGVACVLGDDQRLCGFITDGDVRRTLQSYDDLRSLVASSIMTANSITVGPDTLLGEAIKVMEDRPSQISALPVVDADGVCLGVVRIHDILKAEAV